MKQWKLLPFLKTSSALTSTIAFTVLAAGSALANPLDGQVVSGEATITAPDPATLVINQTTDRAILDWRRFDIEAGETTRFIQPSTEAWTLNRVTGSHDPSRIHGTLEANGNVAIVNPDGILFGADARVDVHRLIATTANISNENFNAGNLVFDQPGNPSASVVNEGTITVQDYGLASFVAPAVRNSGVVTARLGQINLAGGNTFTIDPYGDGLVKLAIDDEITSEVYDAATGARVTDLVKNEGTLKADGGTVVMKAATARQAVNSVVNNTGVIEANSVGTRGGKIILGGATSSTKTTGAPPQRVRVSGVVRAVAMLDAVPIPQSAPRGHVEITGEEILVLDATIDASGTHGGGTVLIGGDYMGGNGDPATIAEYDVPLEDHLIPTASLVALDESSTIRADALENGNGGKVIVWSDEATFTAASISARGGANSGNGGFIETSGKYLETLTAADASAPNGQAGTWLLDPLDVYISAGSDANVSAPYGQTHTPIGTWDGNYGFVVSPTASPSVVNTATIEAALNAGSNVEISNRGSYGTQPGNIYLQGDITKTGASDTTLGIHSANDIYIGTVVDIISTNGGFGLALYAIDGAIHGANIGRIDINNGWAGGGLYVEARDGIDLHSAYNMPDKFVLTLHSASSSTPLPVTVNVTFDGDRIYGTHDGTTFTVPTGGVVLDDPDARGAFIAIGFGLNMALEDRSVVIENQRYWTVYSATGNAVGVVASDALNGIPEIITDGTFYPWSAGEPPAGIVPALEVSSLFTPQNCYGLSCYASAPSGDALIYDWTHPVVPAALLIPSSEQNADPNLFLDKNPETLARLSRTRTQDGGNLWNGVLSKNEAASQALTYAMLADAIYKNKYEVDGWKRISTWKEIIREIYSPNNLFEKTMLEIAIKAISASGFNASVYERNGNISLVFEGSRNPVDILKQSTKIGKFLITGDVVMDWLGANITQAVGNRKLNQYDFAPMVADYVYGKFGDSNKNITATGHSLGGGLAQYVGLHNPKIDVVTFNSAGFGIDGNSDISISESKQLQNVVNIRISEDILVSGMGRQLGFVEYSFSNESNHNAHSMESVIKTLERQY